jgi:hypothetical protein
MAVKKTETLTDRLNNPLSIFVLLIMLGGYVYINEQESQNNQITTNGKTILELSQDVEKNKTENIKSYSSLLSNIERQKDSIISLNQRLERNEVAIYKNSTSIEVGEQGRFTHEQGKDLNNNMRSNKKELLAIIRNNQNETQSDLKELYTTYDLKMNQIIKEIIELKAFNK